MRSHSLLEVEDLCFGFICLFSKRSVRQEENDWLGAKVDFRVKEIKLLMNLCLL